MPAVWLDHGRHLRGGGVGSDLHVHHVRRVEDILVAKDDQDGDPDLLRSSEVPGVQGPVVLGLEGRTEPAVERVGRELGVVQVSDGRIAPVLVVEEGGTQEVGVDGVVLSEDHPQGLLGDDGRQRVGDVGVASDDDLVEHLAEGASVVDHLSRADAVAHADDGLVGLVAHASRSLADERRCAIRRRPEAVHHVRRPHVEDQGVVALLLHVVGEAVVREAGPVGPLVVGDAGDQDEDRPVVVEGLHVGPPPHPGSRVAPVVQLVDDVVLNQGRRGGQGVTTTRTAPTEQHGGHQGREQGSLVSSHNRLRF